MLTFFLNLKIKTKLITVMLIVMISFIVITGLNLYNQYQRMLEDKTFVLESVIGGVTKQISDLSAQVKEGKLSLSEAQSIAKNLVSAYRYDNGNYLWINDYTPTMVMHPIKPQLNGKNIAGVKDPYGKHLFVDMVNVAKESGSGFVKYYWSKPGSEKPVAKLSYVVGLPEWGWIVGTGVYLDDISAVVVHEAIKSLIAIAIVLTIIALMFFALNRSIVNPLLSMSNVLKRVQDNGDLSAQIELKQTDEIGEMVSQFNVHVKFLKDSFSEVNKVVGFIANGEFKERINLDMHGDFLALKEGVNQSAEQIQNIMKELARVMSSMSDGDFSISIKSDAQGGYRSILEQMQFTTTNLDRSIKAIILVMQKMQAGNFDERVVVEVKGDLNSLKIAVNESMDNLKNAMDDITRVVVAQSNGDLTQTISHEYKGALNTLKEAVNMSIQKLTQVVDQVMTAAKIVHSSADEVSKGAMDLSQRVQEQAASLEETSATMEQMNSAVQNNTENAQQAAKVAHDVQGKATEGAEVMNQTIDAIMDIQESSGKIAEIVSLIDGIAFQTNLLALNAAVEAARAGEHGRGFAVVAGEVRSLAQKSADAAKEISGLISESVSRVEQGTKLASASGEVLNGITTAIQDVTAMIEQIAQASVEQAEGVSQVHKAIADIDQVTQQNAALVEQTSASSESMSEQAEILTQDMSFFKTANASSYKDKLQKTVKSLPLIPGNDAVKLHSKVAQIHNKLPSHGRSLDDTEWGEF